MVGSIQINFKPNLPPSASGVFLGGNMAIDVDARIPFTNFGQFVPMTSPLSRLVNDPALEMLNAGPVKHLELQDFYRFVQSQVGGDIASFNQVEWVHSHYPLSLLAIRGAKQSKKSETGIIGLVALLYLTRSGENALRNGHFTPTNLRPEWLASDDDALQAIYTWAIAANGRSGRYKLARLVHLLSIDVFGGLNQYGFAATEAGKVFLTKLGYLDALRGFPNVRVGTYFRSARPVDADGDRMLLPGTNPMRQ